MAEAQGDGEERDLRVVLLLGCAAVLAAVTGAYAAILGDRGSDRWHQAIREDIRQGARIVADARQLYQEEAPLVHRVAQYELRADALDKEAAQARAAAATVLRAEADAQHSTADVLWASSPLAAGHPDRAARVSGRDLVERFGEIRSEVPGELASLAPDEVEAQGSDEQRKAMLLVAITLASGIAFLLGALAEAVPRLRLRLSGAGFAVVGSGALLAVFVVVV